MAAVHAQDHLLTTPHQRNNELIAQTHFGDCECCISVEVEVSQQRKTCEALERDLSDERQKSNQLALDLQQAVNQNAFLTKQLGDLHRKLSLLDQVLEECRQLREDFTDQRQILHSTIAERDWLRDSVIKLNSDIALMQSSEEKRKQLERDYEEALRDLEERQSEIRRLQMAQDEVMTQNRDVVARLEHKVQNLEKQWIETRQNSGRNAAELSGLRQQTHSQLQTLQSSASRSSTGQNLGSSTVRSKETEKEDWKKIAEEAVVTRTPSQVTAAASGSKLKSQDAADLSQASESSQRSAARNGQTDSISEPGDLLDELSDKIDQVLLNKLHHASVSSGPISKLAVFIARYNYDPSQDSPNDNSDSELPLTAGDYIYVYGDPDEDGFYEGELMDGRRGLVPSNFIERIAEENLPDFMQYNGSQGDDTDSSSRKIAPKATPLVAKVPPIKTTTIATSEDTPKASAIIEEEDPLSDLDFNSEDSDARHSNINHFSGDLGFARAQSDHPSDLEDIPEVDEDDDNHHVAGRRGDDASLASFSDFGSDVSYVVPFPRKLSLDRQLKHSVIMSWVAPDTVTLQEIQEFRVYVDGQYRTATKQGAKTRALVENVEPTGTYRISVRTVTAKGMSEEAACMLVIGRDAVMAPTNLKASNVGPSSANISWLPANSNLPHVVSVNGEEVRTVKPGIYKYSLTGLQPLSVYRVNVRAKSRRQTAVPDNPQASKNSVEIEFKTLPGGLPDAPLDVQVRQATNDSLVSVEWLPVTITTSSLSNGAVIMGYAVFINNNKVAETMSPTADRVNIPKSKRRMLSAKELVVRTLSPNGCSNDSLPAKISSELLEESRKDKMTGKVTSGGKRRKKVTFDDEDPLAKAAMYANADDEDSSTSSTSRSISGRRSSEEDSMQKSSLKSSLKADGSPREDALPLKPIMKTEKPGALRESDYMSDSDRSELSDIQEEVEEELSEFGNASLPGLSDSSEGMRSSGRRRMRGDDEKRKVQETLQVLQYNTKPSLDFDTDPEVESLNKPDKVVPIPIIRSQRDYERETEQSPHNPVVEPVPWKPAKKVPQIEITKDANNEHLKAASRKTDLYNPEKRTEVVGTNSVSSASNSLPMASPRSDPRGQSRTQGQRSNSQWNPSSVASSNSDVGSYDKNYDAKSNNDRHHRQADGRPQSESSSHRRSDSSERTRHSRHSDSLRTPESSLSLQRSSRGSRSEETFDDEEEGFSGSEPEELFDDGTIRYFIAIFDYNPAIMSPNIDGAEEELFLKEGDVLKIIGDKDADGFFVGEMNGRRGYVPCNMVEEIESPEQTPLAKRGDLSQSHDRSRFNDSLNTTGSSQVNMYDSLPSNGQLAIPKDATPHHMRALFDYNPQELSPNPDLDMELSFRQGDSLIVYGEMDEDGFFMGELRGKRGLVPSNFLEEVSDIDSSTTSHSYSPAFNRNKENKQSTKDKYAVPAQQQENGEAQYHGSEVTPVISDSAEQTSITSTPEHSKKKKGLLSKGKALFKKLGSSDNKQKHK
ncbi:RIMS-binding protein 2-like isoform X2 [Lytechinus variegatus]|uniref:RIMS-binding protein 2-like isoform X2 n=1 Tax=Lytechinus variegatus TaxID=7654 RepID=UPI001BB1E095|nr:RIMS-binding protein 2-like isoform X2 [Lytechinus variegatus]